MPIKLPGIHHVTAISTSPQRTVDFYAGVLGLRLVKRTVNFDDPSTYHLYFGTERGRPGSIVTFFPWPDARPGRVGTGQVTTTAFTIPAEAVDYWRRRLADHDVDADDPRSRFDEQVLAFRDPDGLRLELVTDAAAADVLPWVAGPVPTAQAIRGFHSATLTVEGYERSAELLASMGFEMVGETDDQRYRYRSTAALGGVVDLRCRPGVRPGDVNAGTVHHIAFRVATDDDQRAWHDHLVDAGFNVTPVIDRQYFHSIYFREPGGVLFEIATDPPGFETDEDGATLGADLKLPPWLEPRRERIEDRLPPVALSSPTGGESPAGG